MLMIEQFLCHKGVVATFREAKLLIDLGRVKVNSHFVRFYEFRIKPNDYIEVQKTKNGDWIKYTYKDKCVRCDGSKGGVPGNENVIDGEILCDYCHAETMDNK